MTASAIQTPEVSSAVRPPTALVDASTRWPVLLMAAASIKWLLVALAAGAISILKLHWPACLANIPALTYGRLVALQDSVFIYGFASQAAMAISLWLICRLAATPLVGRVALIIAYIIWNIGVLVGSVGILAGDQSPFAHLQFPHAAMPVLFLAFCLYGICAFLTFAQRRERAIYPSLWFVLAGIVFFPWIFISASMTLWSPNLRGNVIPLIAAWAGNNIVTLWLGSVALGALYYFSPKLSGKNLYSSGLAAFAFWLYILFGQSSGMHANAAFPAWVIGLSEYSTILLLLPAFATAYNFAKSCSKKNEKTEPAIEYVSKGAMFYFSASILGAVAAFRPVNDFLMFTFFQAGLSSMVLLGFIGLTFLGAYAYILPRITDTEPTHSGRILTVTGAFLVIAALVVAGFIQAGTAADASKNYVDVVRSGIMPAGLSIIGYALMFIGQLSFLRNTAGLFCACCCATTEGDRR